MPKSAVTDGFFSLYFDEATAPVVRPSLRVLHPVIVWVGVVVSALEAAGGRRDHFFGLPLFAALPALFGEAAPSRHGRMDDHPHFADEQVEEQADFPFREGVPGGEPAGEVAEDGAEAAVFVTGVGEGIDAVEGGEPLGFEVVDGV